MDPALVSLRNITPPLDQVSLLWIESTQAIIDPSPDTFSLTKLNWSALFQNHSRLRPPSNRRWIRGKSRQRREPMSRSVQPVGNPAKTWLYPKQKTKPTRQAEPPGETSKGGKSLLANDNHELSGFKPECLPRPLHCAPHLGD